MYKRQELARSIETHGIIQPIMVIERETGYEIVAGERRWRAAQEAKLKKVPCIIRDLTPEQNMLVALIENMQREDLNPIEEASAIDKMIRSFGLTPVSYTHLDVYKRQVRKVSRPGFRMERKGEPDGY